MKLAVFSVLLLLGLASSAPVSEDDGTLVITKDIFLDDFKIYESEHNIVKIYIPMNDINFEDDSSSSEEDAKRPLMFLIEADEKDGHRVDERLFVRKDNQTKKLLDNARDIAAPYDDSKVAYFAAKDGLYVYNNEKNKAEKYGNIDDDLIAVVSGNTSETLYVLTANKELFKVTAEGTKKVKIDDVKNAEQVVLDFANNLFYADSKYLYIVNSNGVKKVEGFPENAKLTLVRPPFVLEGGIPVIADKFIYTVYPNGTVDPADIKIDIPITAASVDLFLMQYYGYNKNVYEFNVMAIMLGSLLEDVKTYLKDKDAPINEVGSRSIKSSRRHA